MPFLGQGGSGVAAAVVAGGPVGEARELGALSNALAGGSPTRRDSVSSAAAGYSYANPAAAAYYGAASSVYGASSLHQRPVQSPYDLAQSYRPAQPPGMAYTSVTNSALSTAGMRSGSVLLPPLIAGAASGVLSARVRAGDAPGGGSSPSLAGGRPAGVGGGGGVQYGQNQQGSVRVAGNPAYLSAGLQGGGQQLQLQTQEQQQWQQLQQWQQQVAVASGDRKAGALQRGAEAPAGYTSLSNAGQQAVESGILGTSIHIHYQGDVFADGDQGVRDYSDVVRHCSSECNALYHLRKLTRLVEEASSGLTCTRPGDE
ncbi:MAG: hypothetical protein WDW36_005291 [Sanguina aurantia]